MKAWYFSDAEKKLRYEDNRPIAIGVTHAIEGKPICCTWGLHGSETILTSLKNAPGSFIWIVELSGEMDKNDDKVAASSRTYLRGGIDVLPIILAWSRRVALDVAHLWDIPEIVKRFLETGDIKIANAAADAAAYTADAAYAAAYAAYAAAYAAYAAAYAAKAAAYAAKAAAYAKQEGKRREYSQWLAEDVYAAIMLAEKEGAK